MKKLIQAIVDLREEFDTYAGREGDSTTLTKRELRILLRKEIDIDINRKDAAKVFKELDENGDNVLDFEEYLTFVIKFIREFNNDFDKD